MMERSPTPADNETSRVTREAGVALGFREVYDAHFAFVWRAVANRGVPPAAIDDVVQEVFLVVYRKLSDFEGRSSMRTWLAGVVRRVVADHLRKRGNQLVTEEPERLEECAADGLNEPSAVVERRAAVHLVEELLGKMSDVQREVFVLYELEQLTTREIAEVTAANENTVQTRLKAARRIFQQGAERHRAVIARKETDGTGSLRPAHSRSNP